MKLKALILLAVLCSNAGAISIIYEDTTHLNKLLCCSNTSNCVILRDLNYIGSDNDVDIYYAFNNATLTNLEVCYDIGNTYEVNIGDWAFMNMETVAIVGFIAVFIILIIYIVLKRRK